MYRALVISAMVTATLGVSIAPTTTEISPRQSRSMQDGQPEDGYEERWNPNRSPVYRGPASPGPVYPGPVQPRNALSSSNYYFATYPVYPQDPNYGSPNNRDKQLVRLEPVDQNSDDPLDFLTDLVPIANSALAFAARLSWYFWHFLVALLIGGALTVSVCTLTPLCTILLGFVFNKNEVRDQVSEVAHTYITPDSMNVATLIVKNAIDRYVELQRSSSEAEPKSNTPANDARRKKR